MSPLIYSPAVTTPITTLSVRCRNENELAQLQKAVNELVAEFGVQGLLNLANKAKQDLVIRTTMKAIVAPAMLPSSTRSFTIDLPASTGVSAWTMAQLKTTLSEMLKDYGGSKGMLILHKKLTSDAVLAAMVKSIAAS
jgi:citrate lyase gamma subunit